MAYKVIDVSEHQGVINWDAVKGNVDGVIIRCGYGDNITSQDDRQWARNIAECERLGIPRGAYLYSYADSDAHAQSELQHLLRLLKGHTFQLPIYLDCEQAGTEWYAPTACQIVCEGLKAAGYTPGVYANLNWWNNYLTSVKAYTRWVAQYNSHCDYAGSYDIWQYSSSGSVPGISGRVDMNWCYKAFDQLGGGGSSGSAPSGGSGTKPTIHFKYRVRTKEDGWLPEVVNLADYAGIPGHAITDIAIGVDRGSLWYQVHVKGGGWLPAVTGYNINDYNNGYAGNGQVIDAVRVYYNTPADYAAQYGYQKAQYRVAPIGGSYWPWQFDNETGGGQDGYAGVIGQAMDRFQLF